MNDYERDELFLKACFEDDRKALDQWNIDSYWTEVALVIKSVLDCKVPGRFNQEWTTHLVVDCTRAIYEKHATLPSRFRSLKTMVQRFAFAYATKYLRESLKAKPAQ
jgi:hypothetical protein